MKCLDMQEGTREDLLPSICSILDIDVDKYDLDGKDKSKVLLGNPEKREIEKWKKSLVK